MNETKELKLKQEGGKNKLLIPWIVTLIGSLMLIITLFSSFASATEDYKERLQHKHTTEFCISLRRFFRKCFSLVTAYHILI